MPEESTSNLAPRDTASARLDAVRATLGTVSDGEIARRLGIARKTVVEYRKRHGITPFVPARAPAPKKEPAASPTGRSSRLDAFIDIIGTLPDREVAERAGMTTENVRMYRQRRGIAATWRTAEPGPSRKRGRQPTPPGETKVDRALAPFLDRLGQEPDGEIAAKAGVSRSAVSAWRTRHEIPARGGKSAAAGSVYKILAVRAGQRHTFGLVAADPVDAARRAWDALTAADPAWTIHGIRLVGPALPE